MLSQAVRNPESPLNCNGGKNGIFLQVLIADDEYEPEVAENLAKAVIKDDEVLGVVGHYSSDMTLRAGAIYGQAGLVTISPTATAVELSDFNPFIFRTTPSDKTAAQTLSSYFLNYLNQDKSDQKDSDQKNMSQSTKVAVAYVPDNSYSESLIREFERLLPEQFVYHCDLKSGDFVAAECIDNSRRQGQR